MMFKIGDKVRVLRHRAFAGNDMSGSSGLIGKVVTLKNEHLDLEGDGFQSFGTDEKWGWIVRTDDIELVTPTGPVREVTTRQVIPGTYGKVRVTEGGYVHCKSMRTAEEIRDTIATLEQIAEAM